MIVSYYDSGEDNELLPTRRISVFESQCACSPLLGTQSQPSFPQVSCGAKHAVWCRGSSENIKFNMWSNKLCHHGLMQETDAQFSSHNRRELILIREFHAVICYASNPGLVNRCVFSGSVWAYTCFIVQPWLKGIHFNWIISSWMPSGCCVPFFRHVFKSHSLIHLL